jgi:hypothetical protein
MNYTLWYIQKETGKSKMKFGKDILCRNISCRKHASQTSSEDLSHFFCRNTAKNLYIFMIIYDRISKQISNFVILHFSFKLILTSPNSY